MDMLLSKLLPLAQVPRLFLACSGGRDSLSLAFACLLLYQEGKLARLPTLLHVHHGMQSANDAWAIMVKNWATEHGFSCHVSYLALDKNNETHARQARYLAMAKHMQDGDTLLLAHHSDDQAETVLMRLIAGAGIEGLTGMRHWQTKKLPNKTIHLHRPWLELSRRVITQFANEHRLPYIDDPTNEAGHNTRSVLRTQILPQLQRLNPQACANIAKSAKNLSDGAGVIGRFIQQTLPLCLDKQKTHTPYQSVLALEALGQLCVQEQTILLRAWAQGDEILPPNKRLIDELLALIKRTDSDHQTELFWRASGADFVFCRYQNKLYRYLKSAFDTLLTPQDSVSLTPTLWQLKSAPCLIYQHHSASCSLTLSPLSRTDSVWITHQHQRQKLHGKKLYQRLKIAPWLRHSLWVLSINGTPNLLIAPYQSWVLDDSYHADWHYATWHEQG